jgi:hypothetical protein
MRLSDPGRLELWPKGYEQQHSLGCDPICCRTECFEARGIGRMRVLEDDQHRIFQCKSLDLRVKCFQRFLPTLLRRQFERRITSVVREREHFGKQCRVLTRRRTLCQQGIELVELQINRVVVRKSSSAFHLANDRKECAIGPLR